MHRPGDGLDEEVTAQGGGFSGIVGAWVADVAVDVKEYDRLP